MKLIYLCTTIYVRESLPYQIGKSAGLLQYNKTVNAYTTISHSFNNRKSAFRSRLTNFYALFALH